MNANLIRVLGVGIVFGAVVSLPAWASHGKVGLWEVNIQTSMAGMPGMPDMSQMPPEARARMQAMMSRGNTIRHCMTLADVNNDKPNMSENRDCKASAVKAVGQTFSVDLVCAGRMNGTGHVQTTFDSPEHYTSTMTMHGTAQGHPINNETKISAHWISSSCGKVH